MSSHDYFMNEALRLAANAFDDGEVPVGAVIVKEDAIIAVGRNRREKEKNALSHAELEAINNACKALGGWRLPGCRLYVTLEPCPMCAGAILNARIDTVIFGAYDKKAGSVRSLLRMYDLPYNFKPKVIGGVLQDECSELLSEFFATLRK